MNFEKLMQLYLVKEMFGEFQAPEDNAVVKDGVDLVQLKHDLKHDVNTQINKRFASVDKQIKTMVDDTVEEQLSQQASEGSTIDVDQIKKDLIKHCDAKINDAIQELNRTFSKKVTDLETRFEEFEKRNARRNFDYKNDDVAKIVSADDQDILPDRKPVSENKEYQLNEDEMQVKKQKELDEQVEQKRSQDMYHDEMLKKLDEMTEDPSLFDGHKFITGKYAGLTKEEARNEAVRHPDVFNKSYIDFEKSKKATKDESVEEKAEDHVSDDESKNLSEPETTENDLDDVFGDTVNDKENNDEEDVFNL